MIDRILKVAPPNNNGTPRVVVPGGIGDIYWILVKLRSFCEKNGIVGKPRIVVLEDPGVWESSRRRSIPFLEMIPFVELNEPNFTPMFPSGVDDVFLKEFYNGLSTKPNKAIYPGFMGYEYLMCYNGIINSGQFLEDADELECDWYFPMNTPDEQWEYEFSCKYLYGKYMILYFSMVGDFVRLNMTQFTLDQMAESINHFTARTGLVPVFIGAWWDLKWPTPGWRDRLPILISKINGAVNLVGQTSLPQAFGAMNGAELVVGYHCGLTNMAIKFGKKTVLLWATGRFPENTPLAIAPPDARGTTYIPLMTGGLTIEGFLGTMVELYGK